MNSMGAFRRRAGSSRWWLAAPAAAAALVLAAFGSAPARAELSAGEALRRSGVVATVGTRPITLGELEDRLAQVPRFQLGLFGDTPAAVRKNFLDRVLVQEALFEQGAAARGTAKQPEVAFRLLRVRSNATLRHLDAEAPSAASYSESDVQAYYDAHRDHYEHPLRLSLWRILCPTAAEATAVLEEARRAGTTAKFTELAREKSLDKATSLRAGNLGFVAEGGVGQEPTVRVAPALFAAAAKVADGEFVPTPIPEGDGFAVIWRRGSTPEKKPQLATLAPTIRQALFRAGAEVRTKAHLDALRAANLSQVDTAPFAALVVDLGDPLFEPRRPGSAGSGATAAPAMSR